MDLQELKKTLPYKWRVQSLNDFNAVCVAYIDSRDVQDLLDDVIGAENWQSDYKEVKGNLYAGVGILCAGSWVWKWDCGVESKTEAEKGEASDSFKRAAVKWGIGRFLYSLDIKKLNVKKYKDKNYPATKSGDILFNGEDLSNYINGLDIPPTNLYNHKELGTKEKPLIPNKAFKLLCERIEAGEEGVLEKAKAAFTLEASQERLLQSLKPKQNATNN